LVSAVKNAKTNEYDGRDTSKRIKFRMDSGEDLLRDSLNCADSTAHI